MKTDIKKYFIVIEVIEILLKAGVDLNDGSGGTLPISIAVEEYKIDIVRYLVNQKIQPLVLNSTPEQKLTHPLHSLAIRSKLILCLLYCILIYV
jgi:hypothetical protein